MRKTTHILMFLLFLHAGATMFVASGAAADLNMDPSVGGGEQLDKSQSNAEEVSSSQGTDDTLFGSFASAAGTVVGLFKGVFALELMLLNLGLPGFLVTFIIAPLSVIVGLDVLYTITGRNL